MLGELRRCLSVCVCVLLCPIAAASAATIDVPFTSYDRHPMLVKLTLPDNPGPHAVVIYVQNAEGMTVDMKRPGPQGTFNYFELHRTTLAAGGVGFFIYEGRCGNEHA